MKLQEEEDILECTRTYNIPRDNVDDELIKHINTIVDEYIYLYPPMKLFNDTRILQTVQLTYQEIKKKALKKYEWLTNIQNKIDKYEKELDTYKNSNYIKYKNGKRAREARTTIKKYRKLLVRKKDFCCVEAEIKEHILIYQKKLDCYHRIIKFRQENKKFELYRSRFSRRSAGIKDEVSIADVVKF